MIAAPVGRFTASFTNPEADSLPMERQRQPAHFHWEGPLPSRDLPAEVLYDVVLRFRHEGDAQAGRHLARSLQDLTGDAKVQRLPLLGTRIAAKSARWQLTGRVTGSEVHLRVHHRLKGNALSRLVGALGHLPGARDLQLDATVERYTQAYSSVGPCSPCAAGRFGTRR